MEKIRQVKAKSLYLQVEKLHQSLTKLDSTIAAVSQVLDEGRHLDLLLARERMLTQIHELKTLRGLLQPQEDDRFMFTPPDQVGTHPDTRVLKRSRRSSFTSTVCAFPGSLHRHPVHGPHQQRGLRTGYQSPR